MNVIRLPRFDPLRRLAKRVRSAVAPRVAILLYHRVAAYDSDPYNLCVTPARFAEHLEVLKTLGRVMSVAELVRSLQGGGLPHRGVAVTFDDGYADNLHAAKPLLEHYDVPAAVFVTTGGGGRTREFWWDELERLMLRPGSLPTSLRLTIGGRARRWDLGESSVYAEADFRRYARWKMEDGGGEPGPWQRAFRELYQLLQPLDDRGRVAVLEELRALAGESPAVRPTRRVMSADEVVKLADGGLVEVGAHTVSHPVLPARPADEQRDEVTGSKAWLEAVLGRPVRLFAYPYGLNGPRTRDAVRAAGFAAACACEDRAVRRGADLFALPRVDVFDWDGDRLARTLRERFNC